MSKKKQQFPRRLLRDTLYLFGALLLIVFTIEMLIMFLLPYILPGVGKSLENFADAFLLALCSAPFIWWLVARPRLRLSEKVLRQSEKRFHFLFENMLEGYAYCRMVGGEGEPRDFVYLSVNAAFQKLTGLRDVVGRRVSEVIPGLRESHPELLETYARVASTGNPERFESYVEPLGVWFSVSVYSPERGCFVAVFDNITLRKRAEEELRERMHLAALGAEVGVAVTTGENLSDTLKRCAEAICLHLDAAFARIWLLNEKENVLELQASAGMYTHVDGPHGRVPVGKFKIGLIAQEKKPHLTNAVVGDPRVGDQQWAKREGMVAFAGHPLVVADQLVGVMAMFSRKPLTDAALGALAAISDQIALGIARLQSAEALRQSEEHFRLLVEHAPDGIVIQTRGCFSYVNRAALELFGAKGKEEMLGKPVAERFHPDCRDNLRERMATLNELHQAVPVREQRCLRLDGAIADSEVSAVPFEFKGEHGALVFMRDIGERKLAERKLKEMQARIIQHEKMASIGQLAAGVAHEINNPIGFIRSNMSTLGKYAEKLEGFIAVLERAVQQGCADEVRQEVARSRSHFKVDYLLQDMRQLVEENLEGTERVSAIVQNLKTFSHSDGEAMVDADLNACLESAVNIVWNEIKYVATFKRDYGEIPFLRCNPQQLNQVFLNLLVNAAHAVGNQGEIAVRTWFADGSVSIAISDTGCGIPVADRQRIFDAFYTTKEVGKGTGLGLSISAEIVKKHNGEIAVQSEPGKGSTFTVRIPATP